MKMHSLLAFMISFGTAHATSFFIRPFSDFTRTTPNIVRGTIQSTYVDHSSTINGEKEIYTYAELDVKEVIKGPIEGSRITIRKLGGTKDGITLEIPSSVEFKVGAESVFFLNEQQTDRSYEVTGMELGRFDLVMEKGQEVLKGGIFHYSRPQTAAEGHFITDTAKENQKTWSFNQLKELVLKQNSPQGEPPVRSEIKNKPLISNSNETLTPSTSPAVALNPKPEPETSFLTQEDKTPLYFEPTLWYTLAILVLTLGAIKYMRRE